MDACAHADVIDDPHGSVCTNCGQVFAEMIFDDTRPYEDFTPTRHTLRTRAWESDRDPETMLPNSKVKASDTTVNSVCNDLRLDDTVREVAKALHRDILKIRDFRGALFEVSAVSAVYFACRIRNVSRGEAEFAANISTITRSQLTAMNKQIRRVFEGTPHEHMFSSRLDPMHLIPRFLCAMAAGEFPIIPPDRVCAIRGRLEHILDAHREFLEGRTPECTCAAAGVVAIEAELGHAIDKRDVAGICGVSLASVGNIVKLIERDH